MRPTTWVAGTHLSRSARHSWTHRSRRQSLDHTAMLAHAPLGRVCHTDCCRETPVVDHTGNHEGRVPSIPLLQDSRGEEQEIMVSHTKRGSSTHPPPHPRAHDFP